MRHVPIGVDIKTALDADVKSWLAFAAQKTDELVMLALALAEGWDEVAAGVYDIHSPRFPEMAEISNPIMLVPSIVGWPTVG
ncbi:methionine synthase II (cobalamin-independent) [Mesorhizobium abyssinicae]